MSPASSFGSRRAGLDDSQNTTITEPDDVPLPATLFAPTFSRLISSALTKEEAREVCSRALFVLALFLTILRKPRYSGCG